MESVWDYPRPPALVPCDKEVRVELGGGVVAASAVALRVLETSHPPTIYVPPSDLVPGMLRERPGGQTVCEWKGAATYLDVVAGDQVVPAAAWTYREPRAPYEALRDHVAFYAGRVDAWLGGERVVAQPGDFYGGWVTGDVEGPFKGAAGTCGW